MVICAYTICREGSHFWFYVLEFTWILDYNVRIELKIVTAHTSTAKGILETINKHNP